MKNDIFHLEIVIAKNVLTIILNAMRKRNNLTKLLCFLRRRKMLCRKTMANYCRKIRIEKTVNPDRKYSYDEVAQNVYSTMKSQYIN